jgi:hypothetical protein
MAGFGENDEYFWDRFKGRNVRVDSDSDFVYGFLGEVHRQEGLLLFNPYIHLYPDGTARLIEEVATFPMTDRVSILDSSLEEVVDKFNALADLKNKKLAREAGEGVVEKNEVEEDRS